MSTLAVENVSLYTLKVDRKAATVGEKLSHITGLSVMNYLEGQLC
jgi:hypothetical protein